MVRVVNANNTGKYVLAVGDKDSFSFPEILGMFFSVPKVKTQFFDKPWYSVYFNYLGLYLLFFIIIVLLIIILGINFKRKYFSKRKFKR